jgi:hypothetical protein
MRLAAALIVAVAGVAAGCRGPLRVLGYTTEPPFDPNIRSVYVPVFKMQAFVAGPERSLDRDLTEAVVRELAGRKTPMRVVSDPARADTELIGTITQVTKNVHNRNPQNLTREMEMTIVVEVLWRDLRSGDVLTNPKRPKQLAPPAPAAAFDPSREPPPPDAPNDAIRPVQIIASGRALPELGESNATADKMAVERMARQIVNMMERGW